ncbi:MAG TPA: substrate-binding domain-containing protein [Candidatus Blautia gallistercoris]|uniref:Substrate-binding domain-containing protein n=1 Tax=Candidatus Blautia gallistercoris TaxID=2838490 RepID=A0A9D2B4I5_9FIRM|nr:substrate-binding domain-containing protein [Candidatus Blautia gallistercoris]
MKKKVLAVLLGAAMVSTMLAGCGGGSSSDSSSSDTTAEETEAASEDDAAATDEAASDDAAAEDTSSDDSAAASGDVNVGFAIKTQNGPYFVKLVEEVQRLCEEKGWNCTVLTADEDITKEAENIETFITQGMDVIFLDSIDPDACIPSIDAAAEAGIPLINLDSGVNGGDYVTTVYSDNKENGRLSGLAYAEWLEANGKGEEEIISILVSGAKGNVAGQERRMGLFAGIVQGRTGCTEDEAWTASQEIEDQITANGSAEYADANFRIVGQGWGNWLEEEGLTATEDFITANPDVNCILGENDQMLFGAKTALENAGLTGVSLVAGADGAQEAFDLIKVNDTEDNPYIVSGLNSPVLVAEGGVDIAEQLINGASWDDFEQITLTEAAGVTKENVDEYYDLGF